MVVTPVAERQVELIEQRLETAAAASTLERKGIEAGAPGNIGSMIKMIDAKRNCQGKKEKNGPKQSSESEGKKTISSIFLDVGQ